MPMYFQRRRFLCDLRRKYQLTSPLAHSLLSNNPIHLIQQSLSETLSPLAKILSWTPHDSGTRERIRRLPIARSPLLSSASTSIIHHSAEEIEEANSSGEMLHRSTRSSQNSKVHYNTKAKSHLCMCCEMNELQLRMVHCFKGNILRVLVGTRMQ